MKTRFLLTTRLILAGAAALLAPLPMHVVDAVAAPMVSGTGGKPLRLKIAPPAGKPGMEWRLVMINGLPEAFALSKGTKLGSGSWSLTPEEVNNVLVLTPRAYEGAVDLEIVFVASDNQTREQSGMKLIVWAAEGEQSAAAAENAPSSVAAPVTASAPAPAVPETAVATAPASAPPAAVPEPATAAPVVASAPVPDSIDKAAASQRAVTPEDIVDQIAFCRELIQHKRIAAARMMLEPLAAAGNAKAAHALGETYDPKVLTALKVKVEKPSFSKARTWYTKAKELGDPSATVSLKALAALQRKNAAKNAAPGAAPGSAPAAGQRNVN